MASIEKRYGGYRVKDRDPLGRQKSKSFVTKDDARRFSREIDGGLAPSSVHRDYCTVRRMFPNTAGNPLAESSFYVHHFTVLIARGDRHGEHVLDSTLFDRLRARSSATSTSNDGKLKP